MQALSGHGHMQLDTVTWETVGRHRSPRLPVLGNRDGLQLSGNRTWLTVPHVVQIAELERQRRAWTRVQHEMNMTGGAIRRRPLVVIDEIEANDIVDNLVPQRRAVLDAGVDENQPAGRRLPCERKERVP